VGQTPWSGCPLGQDALVPLPAQRGQHLAEREQARRGRRPRSRGAVRPGRRCSWRRRPKVSDNLTDKHNVSIEVIRVVLVLAATVAAGQVKQSALLPPATQAQTASFGTLAPSRFGGPVGVTLPYSLAIPPAFVSRAYRVNATGSCAFIPAAPAAGGKTIADSDIGIGIVSASLPPGVAIAPGLDYDPGAVRGASGRPTYAGAASGRATIADLRSGRDILRGDKAPAGSVLNLGLRVATVPQFVTPGSLSCQIVLTVM
jgi:hypothetical protein